MIQTRIPTEILLHIISHLTPSEKREGLLICQEWYEIFRYGLYFNISVQNLCQLKLLFKSLLCSNHDTYFHRHSTPNGYITRYLSIHKKADICTQKLLQERVIIPKVLFEQLPDLCPNLEILDFDPETWKFIHYHHNVRKWKSSMRQLPVLATIGSSLPFLQCLGEGISTLSIHSEMVIDISTQQKLHSILSLVPNITNLSVLGNKSATTLIFTLEDIELIHELLPCLEAFSIIGENIQIIEPLPVPIQNFPTAPLIKSLHWNTFLAPVTWLMYVTHKYPLVENLTLAIRNHHLVLDQQTVLLYINLLGKCCRLKIISLSTPNLSDWFNTTFFNLLARSTSVQEVSPILNKDNQIRFDWELELALQIKHLITGLEIEQWRLDAKLPRTIQVLRNFTQLSHLELKCDSYNDEYDMDVLLDACPVLDSLILIWGTISITNENAQQRHPLRSLSITFVAFRPNTFQYLTNRCRSLSTLLITRCKQLCELRNIATQTVIQLDMPNSHFDLIMLDGVRLDYSMANMYSGPNYVRILSVENKWYQHISYNHRKTPIIQLLDEKDTKITREYFSEREQCSFVNSGYRFLETLSEQKIHNLLKTNLMFGVIKINCKSLKNFVLDGNFTTR